MASLKFCPQSLEEQDKELGLIKINGQGLSRVQLYDFGAKINIEGSIPVLINADMKLSSKKFQEHLDKGEVSMVAREYLGSLKGSRNVEEVTKVIPFEGSKREIEEAEQIRKSKRSLSELVKGTISFIASNLTTAFFTSVNQPKSQPLETTGKIDISPKTCMSDITIGDQPGKSLSL